MSCPPRLPILALKRVWLVQSWHDNPGSIAIVYIYTQGGRCDRLRPANPLGHLVFPLSYPSHPLFIMLVSFSSIFPIMLLTVPPLTSLPSCWLLTVFVYVRRGFMLIDIEGNLRVHWGSPPCSVVNCSHNVVVEWLLWLNNHGNKKNHGGRSKPALPWVPSMLIATCSTI